MSKGRRYYGGEHAWAVATRGFVTMVSPEDAPLLRGSRWHITLKDDDLKRPYVTRGSGTRKERLHRLILRQPGDALTDHVDHNTLNNRRDNLRPCSHSQNNGNSHHLLGASGFRGVHFDVPTNRWRAMLGNQHIGRFETAEEAARAYDKAAVARFGEFATTNASLGLLPRAVR